MGFEKKDMIETLERARRESFVASSHKEKSSTQSTFTNPFSKRQPTSSTKSTSPRKPDKEAADRHDRIQAEMDKCKTTEVKSLKNELESYGVDTKSHFEKSEFIRAVAEARVDGLKKKTQKKKTKSKNGVGSFETSQKKEKAEKEPYDPSYRDVLVRKLDDRVKAELLLN